MSILIDRNTRVLTQGITGMVFGGVVPLGVRGVRAVRGKGVVKAQVVAEPSAPAAGQSSCHGPECEQAALHLRPPRSRDDPAPR